MFSISTTNTSEPAPCGRGRYKSTLLDSETYLLTCYRYIEMNPVRAGMDAVIVVLADVGLRRQRVLARGGRNEAEFNAIVKRQVSDTERREAADFVITNTESLTALQQQVFNIHALLKVD